MLLASSACDTFVTNASASENSERDSALLSSSEAVMISSGIWIQPLTGQKICDHETMSPPPTELSAARAPPRWRDLVEKTRTNPFCVKPPDLGSRLKNCSQTSIQFIPSVCVCHG